LELPLQLFGDTVNTAARMESTGIPGRIQVSTSTAEILKCAGKELWLTPRSDTVQAKGESLQFSANTETFVAVELIPIYYYLQAKERCKPFGQIRATQKTLVNRLETAPVKTTLTTARLQVKLHSL